MHKLWRQVARLNADELKDFFSGIQHGSNQPTSHPKWATLEVLHGGFASGRLEAELPDGARPNSYFLETESGFMELEHMYTSGSYIIKHPENAVLLTVLWLLTEGRRDEAQELLKVVAPYMDKLQFYPHEATKPPPMTTAVSIETVRDTRHALEEMVQRKHFRCDVQHAHANQVLPCLEATLQVFAETLGDGALPLHCDERGVVPQGCPWPFQTQPADPAQWKKDAQHALDMCDAALKISRMRRLVSAKTAGGFLMDALRTICSKGKGVKALKGRQVARVRVAMAQLAKRGLTPTSEEYVQYKQRVAASLPQDFTKDFVEVVLQRISHFAPTDSVCDWDAVAAPVQPSECENLTVHQKALPEKINRVLCRVYEAPIDVLVEKDIVPSLEALAGCVPRMVAAAEANSIEDAQLRRLFAQTSMAFRRRRSLLLLNLAHQVTIDELPWMRPMLALSNKNSGAAIACRSVLKQLVVIWFQYFPDTAACNPFVSTLNSLCTTMKETSLPLTEEIAADIFEGAFSPKFTSAARKAAELLKDSPYAKYYACEAEMEQVRRLPQLEEAQPVRRVSRGGGQALSGRPTTLIEVVAALSAKNQQNKPQQTSYVAQNGQVIEACQILTTHNLAVLHRLLDQEDAYPAGFKFEDTCLLIFERMMRNMQQRPDDWRQRLHQAKDLAYAWRQLVFFASVVPTADRRRLLLSSMEEMMLSDKVSKKHPPEFADEMEATFLRRLKWAISDPKSADCNETMVLAWTRGWKLPKAVGEKEPEKRQRRRGDDVEEEEEEDE